LKNKDKANVAIRKAREYVLEGGEQILSGRVDTAHSISPSPGAAALATLALIGLGGQFEEQIQLGAQWLRQQRQLKGWGRFPGGDIDTEVTRLIETVLIGSQPGIINKLFLLSQAEDLSKMVLCLGEQAIPGLEGPEPDEIHLPKVLNEKVLQKLPTYGRPVVVAASLLAAKDMNQDGVAEAVEYLSKTQISDGSWSEDIVTTSLAIIALIRAQKESERTIKAGRWLVSKQYKNGAWAAFDQLHIWSIGWAITVLKEFPTTLEEDEWLKQAAQWLKAARNSDGSYGTTPPFTHPDLDDTSIALMGLQRFPEIDINPTVDLLLCLQNPDGSWGTFPSFDGVPPNIISTFPVYIKSPDVTVHVLAALQAQPTKSRQLAIKKGVEWLLERQLLTGEFPGVWFEGEIFGTAQTLELFSNLKFGQQDRLLAKKISNAQKKAVKFLLSRQNSDGSWGSSLIETALVLPGLIDYKGEEKVPEDIISKGIKRILKWQQPDGSFDPCYQGIYAKGWNYEEPITSALTALRALEKYKLLHD